MDYFKTGVENVRILDLQLTRVITVSIPDLDPEMVHLLRTVNKDFKTETNKIMEVQERKRKTLEWRYLQLRRE